MGNYCTLIVLLIDRETLKYNLSVDELKILMSST